MRKMLVLQFVNVLMNLSWLWENYYFQPVVRQEGQQHLANGLWNVLVQLGDVIDIEFSCDDSHAKVWSLSLVAGSWSTPNTSRLLQILLPGVTLLHWLTVPDIHLSVSSLHISPTLFFSYIHHYNIAILPCRACLWCTRRPPPPPGRSSARPWTGRESSVSTPWQSVYCLTSASHLLTTRASHSLSCSFQRLLAVPGILAHAQWLNNQPPAIMIHGRTIYNIITLLYHYTALYPLLLWEFYSWQWRFGDPEMVMSTPRTVRCSGLAWWSMTQLLSNWYSLYQASAGLITH